ncbi:MAG: GDSL-type esterase/lipase family protein [Actinomycetota bacterium]
MDLPAIVGRFNEGVAMIDAQTERYHLRWDEHNEQARDGDGPLWVALGDSATQGVGASEWENGWTHLVLARLRETTGEPWRVVNLSMSGGRFADVTDRQIPVLNTMLPTPDLVTCVIGSNDLMWRRGSRGVFRDAEKCVERLPAGTWLSRLNGPGQRRQRLNEIFDQATALRGLEKFNIWSWPSGRNALAADHIHPSDLGYEYMADLAWEAIRPDPDDD